ncbi:MAG: hypothetical protein RJA10_274, partial [Pseudomonadota bacterium]
MSAMPDLVETPAVEAAPTAPLRVLVVDDQ